MSDDKKTGFSGIFSGLKKMVFTEDYLETGNANKANTPVAPTSSPKTTAPVANNAGGNAGIITTNIASDDMVQKIYSLFESMNKPGIDFFELWNAAEAMGGVTVNNLQNAFTTLKVLGLDKDTVLNTGEAYCTELQNKLNADIQKKKDEKESIAVALQNEKKQLERDKQDFENKIQLLSSQLSETTSKLSQLDSKYTPQIQTIETKIQSGVNALNVVVSEIKSVLITVKSNIN